MEASKRKGIKRESKKREKFSLTTRQVCWESFVAVLCCVLWEVLLLSSLTLSKKFCFLPLVEKVPGVCVYDI